MRITERILELQSCAVWEPAPRIALKATRVQCRLMPKILRILAVLLLALTIPVQGVAAVIAAQCVALGDHEHGADHKGHGHAQDGADGHDHVAHTHDDGGTQQGDEGGKKHCDPSTASASIPGPTGLSILSSPSHPKYIFSRLAPLGIQPDGLDRPPLAL
jgi:hypothetical protein